MSDQIDRTMLPIRLPLTDEEQIQLAWPAVIEAAQSAVGTTQRVNLIKSGSAQQRAEAAFWLSQQSSLDASIINSLAGLLGDKTLVDSSQYRYIVDEHKSTLGEEVALALVRIGSPSIPPLIRVLKTSPVPEARKNAARALGALHENGVTDPNAV